MSDEQEKMTMSERIESFYKQSGGPDNPEIDRILEKHLKYSKDHGIPGQKEEIKDAFSEVFLNDHSTQPIVMWLLKMRFSFKDQWESYLNAQRPDIQQVIQQLKNEKKDQ